MQRTRSVPTLMCLWPGLPRLWFQGHWFSLIVAIGFGMLLNVALVSTFVWPAIFQPHIQFLIWMMAIAILGLAVPKAFAQRTNLLQKQVSISNKHNSMLQAAQVDYLAARFDHAVEILEQILEQNGRDVEARLLLAAVFRREKKYDNAFDQLELLQKYDLSIDWQDEISHEFDLVESEYEQQVNSIKSKENFEMKQNSASMGISESEDIETIEEDEESQLLRDRDLLELIGTTDSISEQFSAKLDSLTNYSRN